MQVQEDRGATSSQLTTRKGRRVRGPGVVGKQPVLEPGESFEYMSFCPLCTSFGTMRGTYQMVNSAGEQFDIEVAPFSLSEPFAIN